MSRVWTKEEDLSLSEEWGCVSIGAICKAHGRSENAIKIRAQKLGLGAFLESGGYISLNKLFQAVTGSDKSYSYKVISWIQNRGLPVHSKRVGKNRFRVVYIDEFWKWAEKNKSFIDFSKMEPLILGCEPDWVAEQRKKDFHSHSLQRKDPWTLEEDSRLIYHLKQHRYGYAELSEIMRRSEGAIQRRCTDLGIKERPVKADNHNTWTDADFKALEEGIRAGDCYTQIGKAIGRSEKAVRGKVYFVYLTENADKVRGMMGNGSWGNGAPIPTVKQALNHSRFRTGVKKDLKRFLGVLNV